MQCGARRVHHPRSSPRIVRPCARYYPSGMRAHAAPRAAHIAPPAELWYTCVMLYTLEQVSLLTTLPMSAIRRGIAEGELDAVRVSRRVLLIPEDALVSWLRSRPAPPAPRRPPMSALTRAMNAERHQLAEQATQLARERILAAHVDGERVPQSALLRRSQVARRAGERAMAAMLREGTLRYDEGGQLWCNGTGESHEDVR